MFEGSVEKERVRNLFLENPSGREFPSEALELIYREKLFKLFVPEALSGRQCSLGDGLRIIESCSFIDGDFGWAVQIGAGGGFFSAFFPEATAREFYEQKSFVIAGSAQPSGVAELKASGGYQVHGRWSFCSGSDYATLFTANCKLGDSDNMRAFAFTPEQVEILNDWDAYGMRKTASHTVEVKGVTVSPDMSFDLSQPVTDFGYEFFRLPFMLYAQASVFSVLAGCFRRYLEEVHRYIENTEIDTDKTDDLEACLNSLEPSFQQMRNDFFENLDQIWTLVSSGKEVSEEIQAAFDGQIKDNVSWIKHNAFELFNRLGMSATMWHSGFNKTWRDMTTVLQHSFLK